MKFVIAGAGAVGAYLGACMARAGLDGFFVFGSFAGTAHTRTALARNALRMARRRGLLKSWTEVWLVGDAPQDVLAARANGIGCIAVQQEVCAVQADETGCGPHTRQDLSWRDSAIALMVRARLVRNFVKYRRKKNQSAQRPGRPKGDS